MASSVDAQPPVQPRQPLATLPLTTHHNLDDLFLLIYNDLRRSARFYLRAQHGACSLEPTALVHEVYEMLCGDNHLVFEDRVHFFRCARLMMRRFLIHYARRKQAQKRGAGIVDDTLDETLQLGKQRWSPENLLCLTDALARLNRLDPRRSRIAELRFYLGLSHEEIATVLSISARSVRREWQTAQAWLARELRGKTAPIFP